MLHTHSFVYHLCRIMFFSQYFRFPHQYHSTDAPYLFAYHLRCIMFFSQYFSYCRLYHGGYPAVCHCGSPGLVPAHSLQDFWWTEWHCLRFLFHYFIVLCQHLPINALNSLLIYWLPLLYNLSNWHAWYKSIISGP